MEIEFDPVKDESNLANHGVSLAFGVRVFADVDVAIVETIRLEDEEQRYKAIGIVDGKLWTAIHVDRSGTIRLISVRRSNGSEQRAYDCYSR